MAITGGCLCGELRYVAHVAPRWMGFCYCGDCRKASGASFMPVMGFDAAALTITGRWTMHRLRHADGREAVRNSCLVCGGLVFGGELGKTEATISMPVHWTIRRTSCPVLPSSCATSRPGCQSLKG